LFGIFGPSGPGNPAWSIEREVNLCA